MNTSKRDGEPVPDVEEALKAIYQSSAPNQAFVDQLEQQLRDRGAALADRAPQSASHTHVNPLRRLDMFWQRSRAALMNVAALAALVMLVVALMALFSRTQSPTTTPATSVPGGPLLLLQGSRLELSGPIGQRTVPIEVRAPLPQVPERVPLYDVQAAIDQPSAEVARRWAGQFGLESARLYQDTTMPEATYIAQADDGRLVRVGPGAQVMYQARLESLMAPSGSAPALDPQSAQAAAEAFLNGIPDLVTLDGSSTARITFRVEPSPHQLAETRAFGLTFDYTVLIDGVPLLARGAPNTITIDAEGRVRAANLTPLRLTPTGKEVTVQPVDAVVRAFLNNDSAVLRGSGWSSILSEAANSSPSIFTRESVLAAGDSVTLKGGLQHWVAVDGGADLYFVSMGGSQSFVLEGEGLDTSAMTVDIKGRIAGQTSSGAWRIAVASIQPIEAGPQAYADWSGTLRRQADGAWLETDGGQKYLLPDLPAELADGTRIEAPGPLVDAGDGRLRLEWQIIFRAQPSPVAGSVGAGSVSSVVQEVIAPTIVPPLEPTQVVTSVEEAPAGAVIPPVEPNGAPYSTGVFQSITGSAGEAIVTPTLPAWWTYRPGDDVTLEGELSAQAYRVRESDSGANAPTEAPARVIVDAYLLARKDGDPAGAAVQVMLVGDQVNADLARLSGLHVRVQGRLLGPDELAAQPDLTGKGFATYGLDIAHYEQLRPDETKDVYSGHIKVETLDGREVAILADALSGQDYVLADSLTITYTLEMYRQQAQDGVTVQAIGVRLPDETFAGRPVLRLLQTQSGTNMPEEALQTLRASLANPVQDIGPAPEAPRDVIVDRIELAYVVQLAPGRAPAGAATSPTQLMYELTGHSSDGRFTVTYDLDATTPLAATIEPPLVPPASPAPTQPGNQRTAVMTYTVQAGENIFGIAAKFHINAETILWANEEALAGNPNRLQPGMIVTILPVDGIYYRWRTYDDLAQVAERFGVRVEDILNWPGNHLDAQNPSIQPGTMLIVPGGQPALVNSAVGSTGDLHLPWTADVTHCAIQDGASHGTDRHEIDFDLNMEPVLAARDGTVIMADWDSTDAGGGYVIKIQHDDGTVAVYQHLKSIGVKTDERVAQGQPIGVSGSTGKVTGPMLAFALLKDSAEIPAIFAEVGHELKTGECVVSQNRR